MTIDALLALAAFAFATSITPGPNNLMLMASGVNFGVRRTVPHMLGVALGFVLLAVLAGAGLLGMFEAWPPSYTVLKAVSVTYMLYLAWRIARTGPSARRRAAARPMTFLEAVAFQWVNPKGWAMALTAVTVYAPDRSLSAVIAVAVVFGLVNLPSVGVWAAMGQGMAGHFRDPWRLKWFNRGMALLLIGSLLPML